MEEVQAAMTAHLDQVSGLVQALSSELRRGMGPAADNLRAFVRAVDWTVSLPNPPIGDRIRITEISFSFLSLPFKANKHRALRCALNVQLFQEPWLMSLMAFHVILLLTAVGFRRNANFQLLLLFLACEFYCLSYSISYSASLVIWTDGFQLRESKPCIWTAFSSVLVSANFTK